VRRLLGCGFVLALAAATLVVVPSASAAQKFSTTLYANYYGGKPATAEGAATSTKVGCDKRTIVVYEIKSGTRHVLGRGNTDRHGNFSFFVKSGEPNDTAPVEVVLRKTLNNGAVICLPTHENLAKTDTDADGYWDGTIGSGIATGTDCNDNDPTIHPGATEIVGDFIDSNCNGEDNT
jgi:hypothetical protein